MEITELTIREAEALLAEWSAVTSRRDQRVMIAVASQVPKARISALTGLARTTIDRIIEENQAAMGRILEKGM